MKEQAQSHDDPARVLTDAIDAIVAAAPNARARKRAETMREALTSLSGAPETVDVDELTRVIMRIAATEAQSLTRIVYVPPTDEVSVFVDYTKLSLALLHLVTNAVAAANIAGGEVRVAVHRSVGGGVYIEIGDDGPGMGRSTVMQAFRPFFSTREDDSSGIGLPFARALIHAIGGCLAVESAEPVGTIVSIHIPGFADVHASSVVTRIKH